MTELEIIEEVLDFVRPRLARHGGGVDVVSFDPESCTLTLKMNGACVGCALSKMTMHAGIEGLMKEKIPNITIVDVSDHGAGTNPYYAPDEKN
jgi:Fe-S cluster biogenesis protein NfuA